MNRKFLLLLICICCLAACRENDTTRPGNIHSSKSRVRLQYLPNLQVVELQPVTISDAAPLRVELSSVFPAGYHFNREAPSTFALYLSEGDRRSDAHRHLIQEGPLSNEVLLTGFEPLSEFREGSIVLEATYYYCQESGRGSCLVKSFSFWQPFQAQSVSLPGSVESLHFRAELLVPTV